MRGYFLFNLGLNLINPSPALPGILSRKGRGEQHFGFTLIELLVVVLIISILVAIALPQYQFVVDKSAVSTYFPLIQSIARSKRIYYMENDVWSKNVATLDIDFSKICQGVSGTNELISCRPGNVGIDIGWDGGRMTAIRYCVAGVQCYSAVPAEKQIVRISFDSNGKLLSCDMASSARGKRLCKWLLPNQ